MNERIVLFYGEDTFYIKNKVNQIIKHHEVDDFNTTTYDLDEVLLSEALNDAMTIPFMSETKIVIAQNARFLGREKPKKSLDHDLEQLKTYLDNPTDETILIVTAPVPTLDDKKPLVKKFKQFKVVECKLKNTNDLTSWAKRQIGNMSMSIDPDALKEFMKRVSHSTEFAYLEMKKLLLYAQDTKHIDLKTVEKVVTKNIEDNVYEITNALLARDHHKALSVYHDLILYSEDPLRILGIIINKYREMLHVKILLDQNKDQSDIQAYYKVSSGRAYYMVQNAKAVGFEKIKEHLIHLERLDHNIKTGRIDRKTGLELFILST